MNTNFVFIRHGYGCHNAISHLVYNKVISKDEAIQLTQSDNKLLNFFKFNKNNSVIKPLIDPELTPNGVEISINNGCIINKILKQISILKNDKDINLDTINIVGCSPLIRCMETAYYMSRKWDNPPNKIYVFPLLREIDESGYNKYSKKSLERMNTLPSYAMKKLNDQKQYLKNLGILEYFDFTFVENFINERSEPGDIGKFIEWFNKNFIPFLLPRKNLNVFITTHAGVLHNFSNERFMNNSGFVLNTTLDKNNISFRKIVSLNDYLPNSFFKNYREYDTKEYYCPSDRCGQLCSLVKSKNNSIKKISLEKCEK